jgi:hypothetical protein
MTKQTREPRREISTRDKTAMRREIVAYLNQFNTEHYPTIEPLIRMVNMDFFAISEGNAVTEEGADCSISYYVLFGRKPLVTVFGNGGWTYPLIKRSEVTDLFDLGSGRIRLPRRAGYNHTVDVVEAAASPDTGYDYPNAIDPYRKGIEENFARHLYFLRRSIACRVDKN